MSELAEDNVPRLTPGCRLNTPGQPEDLLLIPEGALRLKGPARSIVELCDGARTVRQILEQLQQNHPPENAARIQTEAIAFLTRLRDRRIIECS